MAKAMKAAVSHETTTSKIYMIRGQKVMIDKDIALIFECLKQLLNPSLSTLQ